MVCQKTSSIVNAVFGPGRPIFSLLQGSMYDEPERQKKSEYNFTRKYFLLSFSYGDYEEK